MTGDISSATPGPLFVQEPPCPEDLATALAEAGFYVFGRLNGQHAGKGALAALSGDKVSLDCQHRHALYCLQTGRAGAQPGPEARSASLRVGQASQPAIPRQDW